MGSPDGSVKIERPNGSSGTGRFPESARAHAQDAEFTVSGESSSIESAQEGSTTPAKNSPEVAAATRVPEAAVRKYEVLARRFLKQNGVDNRGSVKDLVKRIEDNDLGEGFMTTLGNKWGSEAPQESTQEAAPMLAERENSQPTVTDEAERVLEERVAIANEQSQRFKENPDDVRRRVEERVAARDEKTNYFVRQIERDKWPTKPESIQFMMDEGAEIRGRLRDREEKRASDMSKKVGGRAPTNDPFPIPAIAAEVSKETVASPSVEVASPVIKSVEAASSVMFAPRHHQEKTFEKPAAQELATPVEITPPTPELKVVKEVVKSVDLAKENVVPVVEKKSEPSKSVAEEKSAPKVAPEHVLQQKVSPEVKPAFEAHGPIPKLDGLVEFNLGKLGIIDGLDDATTRELKLGKLRDLAPEFFSLSTAQQLYTLEKLGQKKSHDLDMMADELRKNDKRGFLKRVFDKGYMRREEVRKMKEGGAESYAEDLQGISRFTLDRGKDIEMTEKGMMIKFMDGEPKNEAHAKLIREFNLVATKLAEIPYDRTTGDQTPLQIRQRNKFKNAEKVYEEARRKLVAFESRNQDADPKEIHLKLLGIDDDIRMNQALSYDTSVTNKIGQVIRDYNLVDKGALAVGGIALRGVGRYALGFGGGFLASAALGGVRGWFAKRQEFKDLAQQKRYGGEALDKKGEKIKGVKEVIDADSYAKKIGKLIDDIETTRDPKKREALLQSLQNRVSLARERDEVGLVNFGKTKQEFTTKDTFWRNMKRANALLIEADPSMREMSGKVAERMQGIYFKDEEKNIERSKAINRAIRNGALLGAGFFTGGFMARDLITHDGVATKQAIEWMAKTGKEVLGTTKEFAGNVYAVHDAMLEQSGIKEVARDVARGVAATGDSMKHAYDSVASGIEQGVKEAKGFVAMQNYFDAYQDKPSGMSLKDFLAMKDYFDSYNKLPDNSSMGIKEFLAMKNYFSAYEEPGVSTKPPLASDWNKPNFHKLAVTPEAAGELPKLEQTFAMVGGRGAIGAIDDLQEKVAARYGANIPENLKAFMAAKPEKLAQEWGFYRPGEDAESATILKGAKFGISNDGQVMFENHEGQAVKLNTEKFDGKFFDAGHKDATAAVAGEGEKDAIFGGKAVGDLSDQPAKLGGSFNNMGAGASAAGIEGGASGTGVSSFAGGLETSGASSGIPPEGLALNTPEIKGTILAKYDDFGRVTRMEWSPQAKIDEVIKFQRTPDKFLVENLKGTGLTYETRSFAVGELRKNQIAEDCIKYLRLRNMLRSGGFAPNSPEANYISGQMRLVGASIESKIGSSFRPIQEDGVLTGLKNMGPVQVAPLENTAPASGPKSAFEFKPVKAIDETLEVATKADHELAYGTDFKDKELTGHMEFLKDTNGKVSQIVYEGVESPFDQNWKEYMKADWKEGTTAETRKAIQKAVRDLIRTQVIMDRGGLGQNFPEGQEILAKHVAYVSEKFAKYMDMEKFRAALSQKS